MTTNVPALMVSMSDMERMAEAVAKSGLFGMKTKEQALALMLVAQAEGLHPATAAMEYDIIQNKPARKAHSMLARFQQSGGTMRYTERTDKRVAAIFTHPQGGQIEIDWDMDRAKKAGLGNKPNWHAWPRQMLTARVISEGVRAVYPGATGGFYEPSEVADMVDVTPPRKPAKAEKPTTPLHDAETGEIYENGADPFPPSDAIGPAPELPGTTPGQIDESERATAWCTAAVATIEKIGNEKTLMTWQEKNLVPLARAHAANAEAAGTVTNAIETRRRELDAGL